MKKITLIAFMLLAINSKAQDSKPVKDTATYVLKGKVEYFQALYLRVNNPNRLPGHDDIELLKSWITSAQPDSVTNKK